MKKSILTVGLMLVAWVGAVGSMQAQCGTCGSCEKAKSCCELCKIMAHKKLKNGWNYICSTASGARIYAEAAGDKITSWQVREGQTPLRAVFRNAETPGNLRLWWEPSNGAGVFIEAPATTFWP